MTTTTHTVDVSDPTKQALDAKGSFQRVVSSFRDFISSDPGARFTPEKGRYHLYVSLGCPWATRTIITRRLKGLEDVIGMTVVTPSKGWPMGDAVPFPGATADPYNGAKELKDVYEIAQPGFSGRVTVPVLWDTHHRTIVNNESSEIIRMLNSEFNSPGLARNTELDLYPSHLQKEIDGLNEWVYDTVNNGVYKCAFAGTQEAYETAVYALFASLDRLEALLKDGGKEFLVGGVLTEADVRLFVTIVRFDTSYYPLFKCNIRNIRDGYPELNRWLRNLYWKNPSFKESTDFPHIQHGYWNGMKQLNPSGIVPVGPIPLIQPL
ncbi:glutathione S-transferase [Exidia glandulosa HHB12029]|uniref:Glutathione S-transferase n=1 Tax=Exidia glandulosa HHB12029 TaxID=1314781 RepID=A0A165FYD7_EXIGL|nr:glutathione S-transferase [Exidia glandulosa HHB12029]